MPLWHAVKRINALPAFLFLHSAHICLARRVPLWHLPGMKLKDYITKNKISVPEFAVLIGVDVTAIRRYIHGERMPRVGVIRRIMAATNGKVTADDYVDAIEDDDDDDAPGTPSKGPAKMAAAV